MKRLGLGLLCLAYAGCDEAAFVYYSNRTPQPVTRSRTPIVEVVGASGVDILWVIDDSGSMSTHQNNLIRNALAFMSGFVKNTGIDWRIGLISTDDGRSPVIGFNPWDRLARGTPDPVPAFQNAVGALGTAGDFTEKEFTPILRALNRYPDFARPGNPLAIIAVTDAPEQSAMSATEFLNQITAIKGNLKDVLFYGVLGPKDFGCPQTDDEWTYAGSKLEQVIKATRGKTYKLCVPDYGTALADLAQDIQQRVSRPMIYLSVRPKIATLQVLYQGRPLQAGPKSQGGFWMFDYEINAVIFHDLAFAPGNNEEVEIVYEEDDGLPPTF